MAFGGPAAHIALMQRELVDKRQWLGDEEFLDYMGMTHLIPGPNSTEMTMHIGYHRGGIRGLVVAGLAFILPATIITLLIAIAYDSIKEVQALQPIIAGIKAAVISFIAAAIFKLGKKTAKSTLLVGMGIMALVLTLLGYNEILVILGCGVAAILMAWFYHDRHQVHAMLLLPLLLIDQEISIEKIFFLFLKVGAVLFGSGYVLFAYLDGELIGSLGWLTHDDLLEAIAIGQITPGPILSTATFVGYQLGGIAGAGAATLGIFLPSFLYVWLLHPIIPKLRTSRLLMPFLDAVNIAAVAVMISVTYDMAQTIALQWQGLVIMLVCGIVYMARPKMSAFYIIIIGAVLGWLLSLIP